MGAWNVAVNVLRISSASQSQAMLSRVAAALSRFSAGRHGVFETGTAEIASDPMSQISLDTFQMLKPNDQAPDLKLQ